MKKHTFYMILSMLFLGACGVSEPVFISNDHLEFKSVKDSIFNFSIDTYIYNPATVSYQLKELIFDIKHENEKIGYGKLTHPVKIESNDTILLPMGCSMNLAQLQRKHKELFEYQNANFVFEGKAVASHPLKTIRKDISINLDYDLQKVISDNMFKNNVTIERIKVEKINPFSRNGLTKSNLHLNIELRNNQLFDFQITQIELSLRSPKSNKIVLTGTMNTPVNVNRQKTIRIPLDVESHNVNAFFDMSRYIFGKGNVSYRGTGYVTIKIQEYQFKIPVEKEFKIGTKLFVGFQKKINPYTETIKNISD